MDFFPNLHRHWTTSVSTSLDTLQVIPNIQAHPEIYRDPKSLQIYIHSVGRSITWLVSCLTEEQTICSA